jgi:hypothetical protein
MRILFLTDSEPDFGEALNFSGLRDVAGAENVYDYPIKPSYHEGYVESGPYGPFGWFNGDRVAWKEKTSLDHCKEGLKAEFFDFVIAGSLRGQPIESIKELYTWKGDTPFVIYDGWDNDFIQEFMLPFCDFYAKRELAAKSDNPKVIHLPFSIPDSLLKTPKQWQEDRQNAEIDVLFAMGDSHPKRRQMYYRIIEWMGSGMAKLRWEARLLGSVDPALPYPEYLSLIDNSKYAISLIGGGQDTMRFWELLGRTGLIHDYPNLIATSRPSFYGIGFGSDYEMTPEAIENQILNYHSNAESFVAEGFRIAPRHTASQRARNLIATVTGEYE